MKIVAVILVLCVMITGIISLSVSAESYCPVPGPTDFQFEIYMADPSVVIKDGIIDLAHGEYAELNDLYNVYNLHFTDAELYLGTDTMAQDLHLYFSWDDVHGFNFAVKYFAKDDGEFPYDGYFTNFPVDFGESNPDMRQDMFLSNLGVAFASRPSRDDTVSSFYHAVGKTFDGDYLTGSDKKIGENNAYTPVGGADFEVSYPGDGCVIVEWSVPLDQIIDTSPADGSTFCFSVTVTAGHNEPDNCDKLMCWAVSLGGDREWLAKDDGYYHDNAIAILKDAPVEVVVTEESTTEQTDEIITTESETESKTVTATTTQDVTEEIYEIIYEPELTVPTNTESTTPTESAGQGTKAPATGDPVIIAAALVVISACAVTVLVKRRK